MVSAYRFRELLERVRAGDQTAAAELVRHYEPSIRRTIRLQLTDPHLGRVLDSVDICQSVLANFFARMAAGKFTIDSPGHLLKLLRTMARNKLFDHARRHLAERRDLRLVDAGAVSVEAVIDPRPSPGQLAADRDLLEQIHRRLTVGERYLVEQRSQGRGWDDLAGELNVSPDRLRMKLTRALGRISRQLGLERPPE